MKHIIIHTVNRPNAWSVIVIGFTIPAIRIAMILPGPAIAVIPVGLARVHLGEKVLVAVKKRIDRMRKGN